jgi:hypothetical protein
MQLRAALVIGVLVLGATTSMPMAAQAGDGWLRGPGATGDSTFTGAIDAPAMNRRITTPGALQLAGWVVDRTAEGWAGVDDVEIFLGSLGNGGAVLANALFAQDRPDVARALGRPDWTAAGWSAAVSTNALVPGDNVISMYAHSPAKGWWYRQVTVHVGAEATSRPAPPALGFDISFPQCGGPVPNAPAFAIVGVNGGRAFSANPCLARQYIWALSATSPVQPRVAFYMNTGNPGPELSTRWPGPATSAPQPCDGSWSTACAFDYGWLTAQDAYARARSVAGDGATLAPWWLDVEVANSWSTDVSTNSAALQGGIAYLRSAGVDVIGIYALAADWEEIVGATDASSPLNGPFAGLSNWRPGPQSRDAALSWCSRSVTGGRVVFVQFPSGGFDGNLPC